MINCTIPPLIESKLEMMNPFGFKHKMRCSNCEHFEDFSYKDKPFYCTKFSRNVTPFKYCEGYQMHQIFKDSGYKQII